MNTIPTLTCDELRFELSKRHLMVKGNKDELVERLTTYIKANERGRFIPSTSEASSASSSSASPSRSRSRSRSRSPSRRLGTKESASPSRSRSTIAPALSPIQTRSRSRSRSPTRSPSRKGTLTTTTTIKSEREASPSRGRKPRSTTHEDSSSSSSSSSSTTRSRASKQTKENEPSSSSSSSSSSSASLSPSDEAPHPDFHQVDLIHLWRSPIRTIKYATLEFYEFATHWFTELLKYPTIVALVFSFIVMFIVIETEIHSIGLDESQRKFLKDQSSVLKWYLLWIFYGILSSIGLGAGLHTFVLYLAPLVIVRAAQVAYKCNNLNFSTQAIASVSTSEFDPASFCTPSEGEAVTFTLLQLFNKIRLEAFCWGIGTAIGELPPYFVARSHRLNTDKARAFSLMEKTTSTLHLTLDQAIEAEHLAELKELEDTTDQSWMARAKRAMFFAVNKAGFFGIMLAASIPNPLFDLAGITCGHFLIPFGVFFGATLLGKAVIKAHGQSLFVLWICTLFLDTKNEGGEWIKSLPLGTWLYTKFESIYQSYMSNEGGSGADAGSTNSWGPGNILLFLDLSVLWNFVLVSAIGYFLISIVNTSAQTHIKRKEKERLHRVLSKKHN